MDLNIVFLLLFAIVVIAIVISLFLVKKRNNSNKQSTGINKEAAKKLQTTYGENSTKNKNVSQETNIKELLLSLDLGSELTTELIEKAEKQKKNIKKILVEFFIKKENNTTEQKTKTPNVIIFVGVNGVGKTTSIGKLAYLLASQGKSVVLAAADTFRAAAAEQLEIWAKRANSENKSDTVQIVKGEKGADPASIAYKATEKAIAEKCNYLLIDTAGRQQTNKNLMEELGKIKRVVEKQTEINDIYLVIDGTAGQIAKQQSKEFNEITEITGLIVTKLDGTTKGGAVFLATREINVPIKYIGTGEGVKEFKEFNVEEFVESIT